MLQSQMGVDNKLDCCTLIVEMNEPVICQHIRGERELECLISSTTINVCIQIKHALNVCTYKNTFYDGQE